MNDKILVTYASRAGSTAGIAEAIGQTLTERGARVDVRPIQEVKDLAPYRAVVMGSAIQGGQWLPEATAFLRSHQAELSRKPFASFQVCMTLAMKGGEQHREHVNSWLGPVRGLVRPVSARAFAGALDISKIPSVMDKIKFKISVALGVWKEGDHRNWGAVRAWAEELQPLL